MECIEVQRKIVSFLNNELDERDTEEFVAHMLSCDSCMEELAIQYLITEGMVRLEEGSAFNLNQELQDKLKVTGRKVRIRKITYLFYLGLEIAAVAAVLLLSLFVLY